MGPAIVKSSVPTETASPIRSHAPALFPCVGDLAVSFRAGPPAVSRRSSAAWMNLAAASEWQLWQQSPISGWKGFPLTEIKAAGWQVWLLGEIYGRDGDGGALEQTLLEIIRGKRPASQLNGHLLLWAWQEDSRQWHVWTDRFGTLHAYHARHGESAALGTSFDVVAQLASRRQLDWTALAGFFGFGFFPEDRTFYDDVRILQPATHYVFDARGRELGAERYWNWSHQPDPKRSYSDTVAEFADVFGKVMAGLLNPSSILHPPSSVSSRIAIPISGGLDSRSTVATISPPSAILHSPSSGVHPPASSNLWSYSYGYRDDSVETRISRHVAAARALPFTSFTIKPYLFDRLDQILGAVEGFQDVTQCRQAFVADELGQHADFVIAAHWGDVWLDDMGLTGKDSALRMSHSALVDHTFSKMAKRGRAWLLENLCAPQLGQESPEGLLPQFVQAGLDRLQCIEDPDFRVKAFKTDNWSFRWTLSSIRMFQAAAFPRLPFYDTRLADFFSTVPSALVSGRRLQIDYLKQFASDLARIEWQARGADLYHCQDHDAWQLPRRAVKKALRMVTGEKVIERNWEVQFGGTEGRARLEHWLTRPGLKLHEFVAPAKIHSLVNDFYHHWPDPELGYAVSMLLTFSTWLEAR